LLVSFSSSSLAISRGLSRLTVITAESFTRHRSVNVPSSTRSGNQRAEPFRSNFPGYSSLDDPHHNFEFFTASGVYSKRSSAAK
jgi:hypothetical protein